MRLTEGTRYRGFLFDLDGVLIDSMPCHLAAFQEVLKEFNCSVEVNDIAGRSTKEIIASKLSTLELEPALVNKLVKHKQQLARDCLSLRGQDALFPNAIEVLSKLGQIGEIGICTSGSRASLSHFLSLVGNDVSFVALISSEDVKLAKPAPDIYELGADILGLQPNQVLVIEDSLAGIKAGLDAGCDVAAIASPTLASHTFPHNVYVVDTLDAL